jgi:hypothetical protein
MLTVNIHAGYGSKIFKSALNKQSKICINEIKKLIKKGILNHNDLYSFNCSYEEFLLIRQILKSVVLEMNKIDDNLKTVDIRINDHNGIKDIPILSFIGFDVYFAADNKITQKLEDIIHKNMDKFTKADILSCQKELIENKLLGNARW